MTTAHRPTFDPARGKETQQGPAYHQRLLPAHMHLKRRQQGQGGAADSNPRDLRAELLKAEAAVRARKNGQAPEDTGDEGRGEKRAIADVQRSSKDNEMDDEDPETKRRRLILEEAQAVDADSDAEESEAESDESSSEEDDEDEEADLLRELEKIKKERAAQKAAEDAERAEKEQENREVEIARGNPLLNATDFGVKRRWDDDVVFKNQARGTEERGKQKEFVNDLLRSDFHKKFMSKYVR